MAILAMIRLIAASFSHSMQMAWGKFLLVAAPSLLGVAAVCQFYLERRGFKANFQRYCNSVHIYKVEIETEWDADVRDVGAEALHEIIDWYVASVEREICVPRG